MRTIKRGDIYYADLNPAVGSEQGGIRPVLVVQNDVGNCYSPTIIIAVLTSKSKKEITYAYQHSFWRRKHCNGFYSVIRAVENNR